MQVGVVGLFPVSLPGTLLTMKMGPRQRYLLCLLAAQAGCVAVGLWVHGQIVVSSVQRAAHDAAWGRLIRQAEANAPSGPTAVTRVDREWRVEANQGPPPAAWEQEDSSRLPMPGQTLGWRPVDDAAAHSALARGVIRFDGQEHLAVAQRRADGGYTLLHVPKESVPLSLGELQGSLSLAVAITLLWVSVLLGLVVHLIVTRFYDEEASKRSQLEAQSLSQIQSLQRTRDAIVFGLAKLTEYRDQETGCHLERISAFAMRLTLALRRHPKYRDLVTSDFMKMIGASAVLHDIGKVGVPDAILLKPGPLTPDERAIMEQHTRIGGRCIAEIERRLGSSNFLSMAGEIALSHHERWDGTGYPHGLEGEKIPLAARIVAVVDTYDALSSRRVYKAPLPHDDCVEVIRTEAGRHFDPVVVEVFLEIETEMRDIARKYTAEESPLPPPPEPLPRWNMARENEALVAAGVVPDEELWLAASGTATP